MTKQEVREYIKSEKKLLSQEQIEHFSNILTEKFIAQKFYSDCSVLYAYMSYNQEVLTNKIIEHAWKSGKKVAVPKTYGNSYMEFCFVQSFDELALSKCNILEPVSENISQDEHALILMPGLAFDKYFSRIGYGGGYYDKYLSDHNDRNFLKVALGFDFQLLPLLETQEHDVKLDVIITPSYLLP